MINRIASPSSQSFGSSQLDSPVETSPVDLSESTETSAQPTPEEMTDAMQTVANWGEQYLRQWFPANRGDLPTVVNRFPPANTGTTATGGTTGPEKTTATHETTGAYASEKEARQAVAQTAIEYAGTGAHHEKEKYVDLLAGPNDNAQIRRDMLGMSSCGLFARGVLRKAGFEHTLMDRPYVPGGGKSPDGTRYKSNVMVELKKMAQSKDAWVENPQFAAATVEPSQLPKTGDVVMIHDVKGGKEHAIVFTSDPRPDPEHPGDFLVNTAEGGQGNYTKHDDRTKAYGTSAGTPPPGQEDTVNPPRRMRVDSAGRLRMVSQTTGAMGRAVYGWADAGKMMGPYRG